MPHTPGPWHVDNLAKVRCMNEGGKGFIADVGDGRYGGSIPRDHKTCQANARLIAAAPALLSALEAIAESCDVAQVGNAQRWYEQIALTARAVIGKATQEA